MQPYDPRHIVLLRLLHFGDWRVKLYSIALAQAIVDEPDFTAGLDLALRALPSPARTPNRPGVAFCILHQGRGADYVVIAWWDRENELPLRVFVRTSEEPSWRTARGSESICVWDLEVIAFEREAYISTILGRPRGSADTYLATALQQAPRTDAARL